MKNVYKMKSLLLSALLIISVSFSLSAQEAQKTISRSYKVQRAFDLQIDNKYGDIEILNWDKDEVDVQINISIEASSQAKADEMLSKIDVAISEGGDMASFKTQFADNMNWGKNSNVDIHYKVNLPARVNVNVMNKYGDLFIQSLTGKVNLDISYGALTAESLVSTDKELTNNIKLAYSNGTIANCGSLNLDLAYSNLTVDKSAALQVDSRYSKLFTTTGGSLTIEGKYDKYELGEVADLVIETKYSSLAAKKLSHSLSLESAYTGVKVESVTAGVNNISAEMSYGNLMMRLDNGASFTVNGEAKYGGLNFPSDAKMEVHSDDSEVTVKGQIGSSPKGKMEIEMKYGSADIK